MEARAAPTARASVEGISAMKSIAITLPRNWRERLPLPSDYYVSVLPDLGAPNGSGNATATCPLHSDIRRSLVVNLTGAKGLWRCACCGRGDLVAFHMKRANLEFGPAVRDLIRIHP